MGVENWIENIFTKIPECNLIHVRKFDEELRALGRTPRTRREYVAVLKTFVEKCGKPFEEVSKQDVMDWLIHRRREVSERVLAIEQIFVRRFFRWLHGTEHYPEIVAWMKPKSTCHYKVPGEILTREEVIKIARSARSIRDRALIMVLYDSAARPYEIDRLDVGDVIVDEHGAQLRLRARAERIVRLSESVPDLLFWLSQHSRKGDADAPLWMTNSGTRISRAGIHSLLKRAAEKAGVSKNVDVYMFRHSRLTELAKVLTDSELKAFAGWTQSSKMADIYVHLSGEDVGNKILANRGVKISGTRANGLRYCSNCSRACSPISTYCTGCGAQAEVIQSGSV